MMTRDELKRWREAKRWTQTEAAEALGYKRRGYQEIEQGGSPMGMTMELAVVGYEARQRSPGQSVEGTTLGDLTYEKNAEAALHEYDRAASDGDFANWARKWGRAACMACIKHGKDGYEEWG